MKALVPVKRFRFAKQRLAAGVPAMMRERLAGAMAEHVLSQLARSQMLQEVVLVSAEPAVRTIAATCGFGVIVDREDGLNAALQEAAEVLAWSPDEDVAIIHADLPLMSYQEFDRIAALHLASAPRQLTLVPDNAGLGTNLRLCRPGFAIPMLYGHSSAEKHLRVAAEKNLETRTVLYSALSLDCDLMSDIPRILDDARSTDLSDELHTLLSMINVSASALEDIAS
jgi:2-phospho-L-lactate guanylyltransferase